MLIASFTLGVEIVFDMVTMGIEQVEKCVFKLEIGSTVFELIIGMSIIIQASG